jgi:hypothetical protein
LPAALALCANLWSHHGNKGDDAQEDQDRNYCGGERIYHLLAFRQSEGKRTNEILRNTMEEVMELMSMSSLFQCDSPIIRLRQ